MDIATLAGTVAGFLLILTAIFLGGGTGAFLNVPAMLITIGGTASATLVHFRLGKVLNIFGVVQKTLTVSVPDAEQVLDRLLEFSRVARRDGALALEDYLDDIDDEFLRKGVQLVVDGTEPEQLEKIMHTELAAIEERHRFGIEILSFMGEAAPAFGMIGTLIGLVQMLRQLDNPSKIGTGMATALLTTFYGSLLANLLFIPLSGKLRMRDRAEMNVRKMMIEGLVGIQKTENTSGLQERLSSYLHPEDRDSEEGDES